MSLGIRLLVGALYLNVVMCRDVTDNAFEGIAANFNNDTIPGWLGKIGNPLVLAAFPDAARVASIGDLVTGLAGTSTNVVSA